MANKFKLFLITLLVLLTTRVSGQQQDTLATTLPTTFGNTENRLRAVEQMVDRLKRITITGHFQGQFNYAQPDATLRIGSPNEHPDKNFSRIGIRQGRIRTMFEEGIVSAVLQLDITERGVNMVDAFAQVRDPWARTSFLRVGQFFRPFGHELRYPTSRRETPERTRIINTLFPGMRDIGAMIHLQPYETSSWHFMEMQLALIGGNGPHSESDSRKDIVASIGATPRLMDEIELHLGVSYYRGGVYQGTPVVYNMENGGFVADTNNDNVGKYARREYLGFDAEGTYHSDYGRSQLRGEYIFGKQPGSEFSSVSPASSVLPSHDTYLRNFRGGYITFVQDIGELPFTAYLRYDWYDPNTNVSGDEIGARNTTLGDIGYQTWGGGLIWRVTPELDFNAYYEYVTNEKTPNIPDFTHNRKDNVFTLTMLYRY